MTQPAFSNRADFQDAARHFRAGRISLAEFTDRCFASDAELLVPTSSDAPSGEIVCLDIDRQSRCGFPEVIYGAGKSREAIRAAIVELHRHGQPVFVTRIDAEIAAIMCEMFPGARFHSQSATLSLGRCPRLGECHVAVVTAGTSDYRVAAEAWETLHWMGIDAELIQDVGVAGPQRLLPHLPRLKKCDVVVVVAGFEGALASVLGGHLDCPVIAVPTSQGVGVGWPGLPPLLAMLNSCAPNVAVVNVDAGFKAGYLAGLIGKRVAQTSAVGGRFNGQAG